LGRCRELLDLDAVTHCYAAIDQMTCETAARISANLLEALELVWSLDQSAVPRVAEWLRAAANRRDASHRDALTAVR
jgi:hypothetical protein